MRQPLAAKTNVMPSLGSRVRILRTSLAFLLITFSCGSEAVAQSSDPDEIRSFDADLGPAYIDVSAYPAEYQALYPLFAQKCSKCHTLARPINSSMTGDEWRGYVTRMSGKPGSGINPKNSDDIFRFLSYDSRVRARRSDAVDPALVPFLEVSKELSGVARIVAASTNISTEGPELRLRVEGDRRTDLKRMFADDLGQRLARWTQREPHRAELQLREVETLEGPAPPSVRPDVAATVKLAAAEAVGAETDPEEKIELLLDWLDEAIERGFEPGDAAVDATLSRRRGDATEFTRLFRGMAEAVGVPTRLRVGLVAQRTAFHFHPWVEVWLEGWIPVDPYLGQFPADLTHIRLATEDLVDLSAWDAGHFPGLDRLRLIALVDDVANGAAGGGK